MIRVALYSQSGDIGRIQRIIVCPEEWVAMQAPIGSALSVLIVNETVSDETHYISQGDPVIRPIQTITLSKSTINADGSDDAFFFGLPGVCSVEIINIEQETKTYQYVSNQFTLTTTIPGTYEVIIRKWPYQDWSAKVEAV